MTNSSWNYLVPLLGLGVVGIGTLKEPDDLVRAGNVAFNRDGFEGALELYTRAEERTLDPGLVAFDKANALYRLGRFREAESHYRRSREDAVGVRLARLLYNLANSLLQQSAARDASRLKEAIRLYEECLAQQQAEPAVLVDARFNLELAKLLLLQARAGRTERSRGDNPENEDRPSNPEAIDERGDLDSAAASLRGRPEAQERARAPQAQTEEAPPPGKGNLLPIPDSERLHVLSPEDAANYLDQAATRILREQREHRKRMTPAHSSNVMDW
jgi:tetratricopeptide (TPR) repeat protein